MPRAFGSGPSSVLPGKFADDGMSSHLTGKVVASLPEGGVFPVSTSAIAWPASCPGCQALQDRVRQVAPARGLDHAADVQHHDELLALGVEGVGEGLERRLLTGRELEVVLSRAVAELARVARDREQREVRLARRCGRLLRRRSVISGSGGLGMKIDVGVGRFASSAAMWRVTAFGERAVRLQARVLQALDERDRVGLVHVAAARAAGDRAVRAVAEERELRAGLERQHAPRS